MFLCRGCCFLRMARLFLDMVAVQPEYLHRTWIPQLWRDKTICSYRTVRVLPFTHFTNGG